jgi:hypothetical protein
LEDGVIKPKKQASQSKPSKDIQELVTAYEQADLHDKNMARMALRLPLLKEEDMELGSDMKTS